MLLFLKMNVQCFMAAGSPVIRCKAVLAPNTEPPPLAPGFPLLPGLG